MTWLQRYHLRSFLKNTVWFMPVLGIPLSLISLSITDWLISIIRWKSVYSTSGSQAVVIALGSSMLTFIVFVFSMLLVAVQLSSAQLSPRIIATAFRDPITKLALTVFVFTFSFSLGAVRRIDTSVPQILEWAVLFCNVVSVVVYLYLIDHVGRMLRPVTLLSRVAASGRKVIEAVYPRRLTETEQETNGLAHLPVAGSTRTIEHVSDGVFLAFDQVGLVEMARRADCVIELVPQVGDFVAKGNPLFRIHGDGSLAERELRQAVAFGPERTMEQDPAFAFRIIVDIAAKALSAAINDPTTAVLALDQLHHLLRSVSTRRLDTGRVGDAAGRLRLVYRTPNWEDFVVLAVTEIRHYGQDSIQIARRMRAMLENLMISVPTGRAQCLRQELDLLHRSVERHFIEPEDRLHADIGDSQGMGGSTPT